MTTKVEPKDKTVSANGINLHYLDWGAAGSPPIVLLHGVRGHAHGWDPFSRYFSDRYHVLALDQRGRGDSDWAPDGDYSLLTYVKDVEAFCKILSLESFILVGHSMGGRNSLLFTVRNPGKVEKLIIGDVGATGDPPGGARIANEMTRAPEEFLTFEQMFDYMKHEYGYQTDEMLRHRLVHSTRQLPNGRYVWKFDRVIRDHARYGTAPPLGVDMWAEVTKITCPTLFVRGTFSDLFSAETAQRMLDILPNAELVNIEGAGHMVFEDRPDECNMAIQRWLSK